MAKEPLRGEMTAPRAPRAPRRYVNVVALHGAALLSRLRADHPAIVEGRSVYQASVVDAAEAPRLLVDGINQRKIGGRITKGPWRGFPVFTLTLEERATCPASCHHWEDCYGNNMPFARRVRVDAVFLSRLDRELGDKNRKHPAGFAVRLHVLGDFWSVDYMGAWAALIDRYPALHVFGFTAWPPGTAIGDAVRALSDARWERFAVRLSDVAPGPQRACTAPNASAAAAMEGIVCPAQQNRTDCCGTCGLCWAPAARDKTIIFIEHGRRPAGAHRGGTGRSAFYTPATTRQA